MVFLQPQPAPQIGAPWVWSAQSCVDLRQPVETPMCRRDIDCALATSAMIKYQTNIRYNKRVLQAKAAMGDGQQIGYVGAQKRSHQPMAQEDAGRSHQSKTEPLGAVASKYLSLVRRGIDLQNVHVHSVKCM